MFTLKMKHPKGNKLKIEGIIRKEILNKTIRINKRLGYKTVSVEEKMREYQAPCNWCKKNLKESDAMLGIFIHKFPCYQEYKTDTTGKAEKLNDLMLIEIIAG